MLLTIPPHFPGTKEIYQEVYYEKDSFTGNYFIVCFYFRLMGGWPWRQQPRSAAGLAARRRPRRPGGNRQQGAQANNHQGNNHQGNGDNRGPDRGDKGRGGQAHDSRPQARHEQDHFAWNGHDFRKGQPAPERFRGNDYRINDWNDRGLPAPPRGQHWSYIDGNYVLIAAATGIITSILINGALNN